MLRSLCRLILVVCLAKFSSSYYTIISPSHIQSDSVYSVAVASDAETSTSFSLTIENDKDFKTSKPVTIQPQSSQVVDFTIGSIVDGTYTLRAVGDGFTNETTITYQQKKTSIFIQSDKAMYKPGDKVQFRVIVVDKNLNPATFDNMDIYITDASQNRVEQWLGATTSMGVYIGELQLSATPCLGDWTINVNVGDESSAKSFEVAEYVLPKFEVTVSAPKDVTYSDGVLIVTIKALYTYGENVKGVAQVRVSRPNYPWQSEPSPIITQKQVDINGNGNAEFQIQSELQGNPQNWQDEYEITASVTEALTGVSLEGKTTVTIRKNKFTVSNLDNDYSFTPGPNTLTFQFSYYDGSPYIDTVSPIKVSYGSNYDQTNSTDLASGNMDSNGVATFSVNLPDIENGFYIFVRFLDFSDQVGWYSKAQPLTDATSLSVRLITKNPKIGDTISVEITSVNDLSYVIYLVTARGNLVLSQKVEVGNQKSVTVTLQASFGMVPTAQFVVYYITATGEIITGRTEISVSGLNNFVTLKTSEPEKQPGESVNIEVSSKPLSQVCVLGIDQSVALLKTGNDIQQSDVTSQLSLYTTTGSGGGGGGGGIRPFPGPFIEPPMFIDEAVPLEGDPIPAPAEEPVAEPAPKGSRKKRSIWWPGGGGGWQDIYSAGLNIMTDIPEPPVFYYPFEDMMFAEAMEAAPQAAPQADMDSGGSAAAQTSTAVRKYFPETWIWDFWDRFPMPFPIDAVAEAPLPPAAPAPAPPSQNAVGPAIRKYFPETWIWSCDSAGSGSLTINEKAPDTITSWYLTGFATNTEYGLGITEDKTVFKVFKKFFISLNLPYSVKRGEAVLLQVVIFNYLPTTVKAKVLLDNSRKEFEFIDAYTQALKDKGCPPSIETSRTKTVTVNANDGVSLSFLIKPLIVGPMIIKISATSSVAGDAMEVPLLVVPEGVTQYKNKAQFVDLRSQKQFIADLTVDVPKDAVPDSTKVRIAAIGDVMGVPLQNIDNLIQMPSGCGEQTMLGLAPDVVIYDYLSKTGLLTPALKTKLLNYMKQGYQGELSYRHSDYSFSAFGNSDPSGSTWLTAFVLRIFIQASMHITVDTAVITNSLNWLVSQQQADGRFNEPGNVIHSDMQGQSAKGVALTAYVVLSFLADETIAQNYAEVIKKALTYVYQTLQTLDDVYSLSIAAYAAQLAKYEHRDTFLQKLNALAKVKDDQKYWEKVQLVTPTDPWCQPPSVNVEITGYGLLAHIAAGRVLDGLPIMKWIIAQQTASGGYGSTQDTVVGITALATFAAEISGANVMSCTFNYAKSSSTLKIDKTNSLVLQTVDLPSTTTSVKVTCTGSGFSLIALSWQYNLNIVEISPRFKLDVTIDKKSNDYSLVLNICTSYITGKDGDTSNMALMEVELPTGFTADLQSIKDALKPVKGFKKAETKKGNSVAVIYLDNVSTTQICLQITAYRICQIADEKPVAVTVQDYYSNDRRKTTFYSRTPKGVCAICDDDECKAACKKSAKDIKCPPKKRSKEICDGANKIFRNLAEWFKKILAQFC